MRPIIRGPIPKDSDGNDIVFTKYARSRRYLIDTFGEYCSYCERKIEANLAVEHVLSKDLNPLLKFTWTNFLLACTNCNSTKGNKAIRLQDYYWPDTDNTYEIFSYDNSGIVHIANHIITPESRIRAQNTMDLVGLQKHPPRIGTANWEEASDRRYEHRIQAWIDSEYYSNKYKSCSDNVKSIMLPCIRTIVLNQGFWSIWMHAFEECPEVQKELLACIPGTNSPYFLPNL